MNHQWSSNDVRMLFHKLIHVAALKGGILSDDSLEEVREYIKSSDDLIDDELCSALFDAKNSGRSANQEIALKYHYLTGVGIAEARDFAKEWIVKAKKALELMMKKSNYMG